MLGISSVLMGSSGIFRDTITIKTALDTIVGKDEKTIVLFQDNKWFFEDDIYSGNYFIDTLLPLSDTPVVFKDWWVHHHIHVDTTDLVEMKDTLNLPLINKDHKKFYLPKQSYINYEFGFRRYNFHYGVDLKSAYGDNIYSCFDGKVRYAGYNGNYGNVVVIRHYNGLETVYAHLSKIKVVENQLVRAGKIIGYAGSTGRSTGPHLHFEVRYKGNAIDPELIFDFNKNKLVGDTLLLDKSVFAYKKEVNKRIYHRIRSGDTLSGLAVKYGTSITKICRLNGISRNYILRVGRKLRVR